MTEGSRRRTQPEVEAIWAAQAANRDDFEEVERSGERHPETWTGIAWDVETPGRILVLTTEPDAHRAALVPLLTHPEALEIRRARYSRRRLDAVWDALRETVPAGAWTSMGPSQERVTIRLQGQEGELAARLHRRFGDALEITLGAFRYPPDPAERSRVRPAPTSTLALPQMSMQVLLDRDTFPVGEEPHGVVRCTNSGDTALVLTTTNGVRGHVLDAREQVIGASFVSVAIALFTTRIQPRAETLLRFSAGVDCLDPALGTVVPPGDYGLVVSIRMDSEQHPGGVLVSDAVPVRIV